MIIGRLILELIILSYIIFVNGSYIPYDYEHKPLPRDNQIHMNRSRDMAWIPNYKTYLFVSSHNKNTLKCTFFKDLK